MIETLKARGFRGHKDKLGMDEIEVDFRGREGLIAFDGPNGLGKTTTLELLTPYASLVSRDTALYQNVILRDSFKDLSFTHAGHHYRTLIKVDCDSKRSEGFAWIDHGRDSVINGKISEYHKWATETFGSQELFNASVFGGQGAKKLCDMRVGELRSLFNEFLGRTLLRLETWADASRQAGSILSGQLAGVDQRMATIKSGMDSKEAVDFNMITTKGREADLYGEKDALWSTLADKRAAVDILKATIQQNALALQRKADLQAQINRMEGELAKEKQAAEGEIGALAANYREIKYAIGKQTDILQDREEIEKAVDQMKIAAADSIVIQEKIDALSAELPTHQQKVHDLEKEITQHQHQLKDIERDPELQETNKKIGDAEAAITAKKKEIRDLENDFQVIALRAEIRSLEKAALVGDGIDVDCKSVTCAAIKSVNEAKEKIPMTLASLTRRQIEIKTERGIKETELLGLEVETLHNLKIDVEERIESISAKKQFIEDQIIDLTAYLNKARQTLLNASESLKMDQRDLAAARAEITKQKALADKLPDVRVAETRKADLEKQLAEVTAQGTAKKEVWGEKEAGFKQRRFDLELRGVEIIIDESAAGTMQAVLREIIEIETVRIPAIEAEIQTARDRIATLQAELARIEAAEKELHEVRAERERLSARVARWKYLQIGCGKNGLQALEIDGAAPEISKKANELLHAGFGPSFSVKIITQDGEGRETLDILVISEHGEDRFSLKSGGEKVWLLHPIRLGMALVSKDKGGREWDTAFFDETDGPLDSKGAATQFMEMYRPFMQVGNIRQLFYVTHRDECKSYADHVLTFEHGKNPGWG